MFLMTVEKFKRHLMSDVTMRRSLQINLRFILAALFFANALFSAYVAVAHLNFLQVDMSGHIWSSVQTARGLFHRFSDQIFLGYTHGLFYPPVEDFLQAMISWITGQTSFSIFPFYLALLILFFFYVAWRLSRHFSSKPALLFFSLCTLFLSNLEKTDALKLQGLSMVDLFVTGLSSETLSFCFFLLLLEAVLFLKPFSRTRVIVFLSLTVLSHIVVGLVAILWMLVHIISTKERKELVKSVAVTFAVTAFYWLPLAVFRSQMASSEIFHWPPWWAFLISGFVILWALRIKDMRVLGLVSTSMLLFAAIIFIPMFETLHSLAPKFHYYRFAILGYFLLIAGIAVALDGKNEARNKARNDRKSRIVLTTATLGFVAHLVTEFTLQPYDFDWISFKKTKIDLSRVGNLQLDGYGRYLIFGSDRTADTGVDSILAAYDQSFRSTKGLFWESSKTNTLQSSFLATLLTPPVVLDYYYFKSMTCEEQKCMLDQMLRYYNVKGFIGSSNIGQYIPKEKVECYRDIFTRGTSRVQFQVKGALTISNETYPIFRIVDRQRANDLTKFSFDAIEPLAVDGIQTMDANRPTAYSFALDESYKYCSKELGAKGSLQLIAKSEDWSEISRLRQSQAPLLLESTGIPSPLTFLKISDQEFKIKTPSDRKRLYVIKLSPQPGAKAFSSDGQVLPLFATFPYILIYGSGEITLKFEKTEVMYLGYLISLVAMLGLFFRQAYPLVCKTDNTKAN